MVRRSHKMQGTIRKRLKRLREFGWKLHSTTLMTRLTTERRNLKKVPIAIMYFTALKPFGGDRMIAVKVKHGGGSSIKNLRMKG